MHFKHVFYYSENCSPINYYEHLDITWVIISQGVCEVLFHVIHFNNFILFVKNAIFADNQGRI